MNMHPDTWLISQGRPTQSGDPLNFQPTLASNFRLPGDRYYGRSEGSETQAAFEHIMDGLEGGRSLAFSSGMAAVHAVFGAMHAGATIVIPNDPYHGTNGIAVEGEEQGRWTVVRLDLGDTAAWIDAAPTADLLWVETPANPLMTVADLPAICAAPRKAGSILGVDGTFATPLVQQPIALGADISMHSATKFIGGHSDLLAGVLTVAPHLGELYDELWNRRMIYGGTIGAMEAFLAIRGSRTLSLRMEKAMANARVLAERLEAHPEIARVRFPGLESHETHTHAAKFMDGYGAMLSFEVTGSGERASAVVEHTTIINNATSLGGVESTWERRALITGQESMPPTLIRFSVGCEHVEDLWTEITAALDATAG